MRGAQKAAAQLLPLLLPYPVRENGHWQLLCCRCFSSLKQDTDPGCLGEGGEGLEPDPPVGSDLEGQSQPNASEQSFPSIPHLALLLAGAELPGMAGPGVWLGRGLWLLM